MTRASEPALRRRCASDVERVDSRGCIVSAPAQRGPHLRSTPRWRDARALRVIHPGWIAARPDRPRLRDGEEAATGRAGGAAARAVSPNETACASARRSDGRGMTARRRPPASGSWTIRCSPASMRRSTRAWRRARAPRHRNGNLRSRSRWRSAAPTARERSARLAHHGAARPRRSPRPRRADRRPEDSGGARGVQRGPPGRPPDELGLDLTRVAPLLAGSLVPRHAARAWRVVAAPPRSSAPRPPRDAVRRALAESGPHDELVVGQRRSRAAGLDGLADHELARVVAPDAAAAARRDRWPRPAVDSLAGCRAADNARRLPTWPIDAVSPDGRLAV